MTTSKKEQETKLQERLCGRIDAADLLSFQKDMADQRDIPVETLKKVFHKIMTTTETKESPRFLDTFFAPPVFQELSERDKRKINYEWGLSEAAIFFRNHDLCLHFLKKNSWAKIPRKTLESVFSYAAGHGHMETIKWFRKTHPEIPPSDAFVQASVYMKEDIVLYLLDKKTKNILLDKNLLMPIIKTKNTEILQKFMSFFDDKDQRDAAAFHELPALVRDVAFPYLSAQKKDFLLDMFFVKKKAKDLPPHMKAWNDRRVLLKKHGEGCPKIPRSARPQNVGKTKTKQRPPKGAFVSHEQGTVKKTKIDVEVMLWFKNIVK